MFWNRFEFVDVLKTQGKPMNSACFFMCSAKRRVMKPRIPKPTPTAHFLIMLLSVDHLRGPEVEICLCFLVVLCWLVGSRGWIIFFELCVAVGPRFFRPKSRNSEIFGNPSHFWRNGERLTSGIFRNLWCFSEIVTRGLWMWKLTCLASRVGRVGLRNVGFGGWIS